MNVQTLPLGVTPGTQVTESENHPNWRHNQREGDVGGEFFSQKRYIVNEGSDASVEMFTNAGSGITYRLKYEGPVYAFDPVWDLGGGWQVPNPASDADLDKLGATAISRTSPTNAVINLVTFLGEILREGIPHAKFDLWKGKVEDIRRNAGKDYLNLKFGWEPLIRDVSSSVNQISHAEHIIAQYERDAGKVVRRQYRFPEQRSISYNSWVDLSSPYYGPHNTDLEEPRISHIIDTVDETVINRWFSGAYTYYLPDDWVSRQKMKDARDVLSNIFDITPTPESVWNLTPWSWAVDWFTNTGDVLKNLSSFAGDSLVLRYGYVMQHTLQTRTYKCRDPAFKGGLGASYKTKFVVETKQRRRATPYGFGFNLDGLSATQAAILAALGLSKS